MPATPSPLPDWIGPFITQLGVAIIFIIAWNNERMERVRITADKDKVIAQISADKDKAIAELNAKMGEMQTQHRLEMMQLLQSFMMPKMPALDTRTIEVAR